MGWGRTRHRGQAEPPTSVQRFLEAAGGSGGAAERALATGRAGAGRAPTLSPALPYAVAAGWGQGRPRTVELAQTNVPEGRADLARTPVRNPGVLPRAHSRCLQGRARPEVRDAGPRLSPPRGSPHSPHVLPARPPASHSAARGRTRDRPRASGSPSLHVKLQDVSPQCTGRAGWTCGRGGAGSGPRAARGVGRPNCGSAAEHYLIP